MRGTVLVEWMLSGSHGSADPGLGMNRAPGRLSLAVLVLVVLVPVAGSRRTTLCAPFRTWRSTARNRPAQMAGDVLPEIDSYGSLNLGKPWRGDRMSEA